MSGAQAGRLSGAGTGFTVRKATPEEEAQGFKLAYLKN